MTDGLRAELPDDLADELIRQGFEESFALRSGFLADAGTVMTVASNILAIGGNGTLIVVSRKDIGVFVAAVRDWILRKKASKPGNEITMNFSARRGESETNFTMHLESSDGIADVDTTGLFSFVSSLFAGLPIEAGDGDASASA
jgi:hypothetical protein